MKRETLVLAGAFALLGGCSSMVHGPYQDVAIDSSPPGATATITPMLSERGPLFLDKNKKYTVTTPATVRLLRDNSYRVEMQKTGYKITSTKIESAYDWLWAPALCGPCEMVGDTPTFDLKGRAWPVRFAEAVTYSYPRGFVRAIGRGARVFSPEAMMGHSFKLRPEEGGFFSGWHGVGTPTVAATLEPTER
jgi:hypothetical protein